MYSFIDLQMFIDFCEVENPFTIYNQYIISSSSFLDSSRQGSRVVKNCVGKNFNSWKKNPNKKINEMVENRWFSVKVEKIKIFWKNCR